MSLKKIINQLLLMNKASILILSSNKPSELIMWITESNIILSKKTKEMKIEYEFDILSNDLQVNKEKSPEKIAQFSKLFSNILKQKELCVYKGALPTNTS